MMCQEHSCAIFSTTAACGYDIQNYMDERWDGWVDRQGNSDVGKAPTRTASSPPDSSKVPSALKQRQPTGCACQCTVVTATCCTEFCILANLTGTDSFCGSTVLLCICSLWLACKPCLAAMALVAADELAVFLWRAADVSLLSELSESESESVSES